MMIMLLKPNDTIFSKTGRPFSWGEESFAEGIFPPPPGVFYGALRTAYFSENISEFKAANTPDDRSRDLVIKNILLYKDTPLYPAPLDLMLIDDKYLESGNLKISTNTASSDYRYLITTNSESAKSSEAIFLSQAALKFYMNGVNRIDSFIRMHDIALPEPKVGIKRSNKTGTVDEGMLYRVNMMRPEPGVGFIVEFDGLEVPGNSIIRLGGEGKTVSATASKVSLASPDFRKSETGIYKLYFLTPAVFETGSIPGIFVKEKSKYEILTAVTGKAIRIGGFDMLTKRPKPMYKYVPAGSIYYFKAEEDDVRKLIALHSLSDFGMERYGYGIFQIIPFRGEVQ